MASTQFTATGNGLNTLVESRLLIEAGILEGIAVHSGQTTPPPNTTWAEVSLEKGGESLNNRVVILAAGYVGGRQVLSWTDKITTEPGLSIVLRIWSVLTHETFLGMVPPYVKSPRMVFPVRANTLAVLRGIASWNPCSTCPLQKLDYPHPHARII